MSTGRETRASTSSKTEKILENTNSEQRHVIRFLYRKGTDVKQIHQQLEEVYSDSAYSERQVFRWVSAFKCGKNDIEDESRSGRPKSATSLEVVQIVEKLVMSDRRKKVRELANEVGIDVHSVWDILHRDLELTKVCSRWVIKNLNIFQKQNRVKMCQENLDFMGGDKYFFQHVVTGDETWCHWYDPESKQESMQWKHKGSPTPKKFKVQKSAGKVMSTVFWDREGILLIEFMVKGHTITGMSYKKTIENLRQAVLEKRAGGEKRRILLLHDNAPAHTSHLSRAAIQEQGMTELFQPPYSPDIAPSDYYLFRHLKKFLRGQRFSSDNEVMDAVKSYFDSQDKSFYSEGIESLKSKWTRCIEVEGEYIEK